MTCSPSVTVSGLVASRMTGAFLTFGDGAIYSLHLAYNTVLLLYTLVKSTFSPPVVYHPSNTYPSRAGAGRSPSFPLIPVVFVVFSLPSL